MFHLQLAATKLAGDETGLRAYFKRGYAMIAADGENFHARENIGSSDRRKHAVSVFDSNTGVA